MGIKDLFDSDEEAEQISRGDTETPPKATTKPMPPVCLTVNSKINDGSTERLNPEVGTMSLVRNGWRYRSVKGSHFAINLNQHDHTRIHLSTVYIYMSCLAMPWGITQTCK